MCGCVEQMPTVSRSDCTQVDLEETIQITFNSRTNTFHGKLTQVDVSFNSCKGVNNRNNDLWAYMARLFYQGDISPTQFGEAGRIITNSNCDEATRHGINDKGYRPGFDHDVSEFTLVAGRDDMKLHAGYGKLAFEQSLARGANPSAGHFGIIRRICQSCVSSHKDIFYRRLTAVPADKALLRDILYMDREMPGNKWNVDFSLHSSLDDAISGENSWKCNDGFQYSSPFYGECSPDGTRVRNQRSMFFHDHSSVKIDVAYYVFKPEDDKFESMTDSDNVHSIGVGYHKRADALVLYDKDDGSIYMAGRGGAPNIWTEPDQIVFYGQEFSGDYSVVVKADSISPSGRDGLNGWSKAGITFRSTLDPSSEHYTLMLTGNQGMGPHWRPTRGAQTTWGGWNYFINRGATEAWLKLVKRGDILMSYIGTEGEEGTVVWESLHTIEMKLEETYFIGLVICAQSSRYEIEARFANFEVTELADADSMTNLALGKPVMQSSTGWGGVAERAVDGNTNGNYHDNTVTHTAYGDSEPWFVVDLGGLSLIEIIYVYSRTDCCYWRHKGALVELIHEGKVVGTRNLHGNKLDVIDFSDGSYLASKIRVSSNTYISIAEFEVYGEVSKTDGEAGSSSPTNLALGKPVEQSTTGWGGVAERAVDGDTNGIWSGGSVTHTYYNGAHGETIPWFKLDLLQPSSIDYIKVYGRTDCCSWRTRNAIVEFILGGDVVCTRNLFGSDLDILYISDDSCIASEIRVTNTDGQSLSLAELEVYGTQSV